MDPRKDIQFIAGDLVIANNDIVFDYSDPQHIQDTINAGPAWWKENFSDGVNILSFLNSAGQEQVIARAIKIQLESDLYIVNNPVVTFNPDGSLNINPNANI